MAKRTKADATEDQVTPQGDPVVNPQEQLSGEEVNVNEGTEGEGPKVGTAALPGSGLPPFSSASREGEIASIEGSGRPDPRNLGEGVASPPVAEGRQDINPVQQAGSDKHYAAPADARIEVVDAARGPDQSEAPPPFRRRDGFPDITSESVQVLMLGDYHPEDPSRYGNQLRAREGELVSFGSDEAISLIDAGLAERVDDEKVGFQQDIPQPGEKPLDVGHLPVLNQETGVPESPPPGARRSADPAAAQSPSSTPRLETETPAPGGGPSTVPAPERPADEKKDAPA
jgi:hypothetical protein